MNPAILNYLQSQQGQPQGEAQASPMQQNQGQQAPYNPFDSGIRSAIESAKQSLGMTEKQQGKAFRQAMLAIAANNSQQPKQRGFFNNFGSVARSLGPAVEAHDQAEDEALTQNNAMANQILAYKAAEEAKQVQAEDQAWRRQHAESQLEEAKRSHNLMDRFRRDSLESKNQNQSKSSKHGGEGSLDKIFNNAEKLITDLGSNARRTKFANLANTLSPFGYGLNEDQAKINTIGDVLRGQLFNAWGYRNKDEFKHVPSISADNSPEVNLAIIKQLKGLLSNSGQMPEQEITSSDSTETSEQYVTVQNPETGETTDIMTEDLPEAINRGWIQAQ